MVYLDNAATTQPAPQVVEAVLASMSEDFFNPSAIYGPAVQVNKEIESCRNQIKSTLGADSVVFTSGGTEANNLAIIGCLAGLRQGGKVLYSLGEHPSVRAACQALPHGFTAIGIPLTQDGLIDLAALDGLLTADTALICLMQVNNETGAVQPLGALAALAKQRCPSAWLHVDGVQGFLRLPMGLKKLGIDSYALSGHKIHGPKGIGALALGGKKTLKPQMLGGGQEAGLRSGTENTPGIAGLKAAIESFPRTQAMRALKIRLFEQLRRGIPELIVNGPDPAGHDAADHIINLAFPPVRAETMLHALEARDVFVSHGSACSSRKSRHSETLKAMGAGKAALEGAIRFSLSPYTTEQEIDQAANACVEAYLALKQYTRR